METDLGNPIDYNPSIDPLNQERDEDTKQEMIHEPNQQYYFHPSEMQYNAPVDEKKEFFASIDKSTWIIAFAVFLLGFFMGKTMQPVILRYT